MLIHFVFLHLHVYIRPYAEKQSDKLEGASLSLLILIATILTGFPTDSPRWEQISISLLIIVPIGVFVLVTVWRAAHTQLRLRRSTSSRSGSQSTLKPETEAELGERELPQTPQSPQSLPASAQAPASAAPPPMPTSSPPPAPAHPPSLAPAPEPVELTIVSALAAPPPSPPGPRAAAPSRASPIDATRTVSGSVASATGKERRLPPPPKVPQNRRTGTLTQPLQLSAELPPQDAAAASIPSTSTAPADDSAPSAPADNQA